MIYLITLKKWNDSILGGEWDDTLLWLTVGKNGKKRTKPQPVKLTAFQKLKLYVLGALRYGD